MPHSSFLPAAPAPGPRLAACALVAALTFACYHATLLPGLDFGDTAAYQAAVGDWRLTPRQAYPLYYAIANTIFAFTGGEPAHSLNLTSALAGGAACGALVWVASALTGSVLAGVWAGLLLGASYTFWSQAIIGEVYTLHVLLTSLVLAAGLWWHRRPSLPRLTLLFGLYALGFGNHLMMMLLAPALVALIVLTPGRPTAGLLGAGRGPCPRVRGAGRLAVPVERRLSLAGRRPDPVARRRPPHVLVRRHQVRLALDDGPGRPRDGVEASRRPLRLRSPAADRRARHRAGAGRPGLPLATMADPGRAGLAYGTAFGFAYTYNVGDVHVFFLPSHQIVILAAAIGAAAVVAGAGRDCPRPRRAGSTVALAVVLFALPAWRIWDTWPAVDRHDDTRPLAWLEGLTRGVGEDTLLLADINWQLDNGLDYFTRHVRPDLNVARVTDRVLTLAAAGPRQPGRRPRRG